MGIEGLGDDIQVVGMTKELPGDYNRLARQFVLRQLKDDPEAAKEIIEMLGVEERS